MNETNRSAIVLVAALWIILMGVIVFLTWAWTDEMIDRVGDFAEYLNDNNTTAGKLIVTLAALAAAVLGLLVIVLELAPEEEVKELRVEQAGSTTIVPAEALRLRLEEALTKLADVSTAKAQVSTRDKGIATALDLTLRTHANVAFVTQEAARVVVDTIQTDLGLPVSGLPTVRIAFSAAGPEPEPPPVPERPEEPPLEPAPAPPPVGAAAVPAGETDLPVSEEAPPGEPAPPFPTNAPLAGDGTLDGPADEQPEEPPRL